MSACTLLVTLLINLMAGMAGFFNELRGWLPHRGKAQMACKLCSLSIVEVLFNSTWLF